MYPSSPADATAYGYVLTIIYGYVLTGIYG